MKKLTRIRLVNWHYFVNETITVKGSFLISGENTSGKSTLLDAIQLVLTTNTKKFNTAANEKSNRDLKGYVRCKTGNEDIAYARQGGVITYVALEFYEEKAARYFTLGIKIDSPDEESSLTIRWFREEFRLEDLTFLTGNRPSTTEEFYNPSTKVRLIQQHYEARAQFKQRLGNLEDRFFEMVPKSLAFKPMDNVKDFINRFILSEKQIEVATLRNNIATLKELEDLMILTRRKIDSLEAILTKHDEIQLKEREIKTHEILIGKAKLEKAKNEGEELARKLHQSRQNMQSEIDNKSLITKDLRREQDRLTGLNIALGQNTTTLLINDTKHRIEMLEKDRNSAQDDLSKLNRQLTLITEAATLLAKDQIKLLSREDLVTLGPISEDSEAKSGVLFRLKKDLPRQLKIHQDDSVRQSDLLEKYKKQKTELEQEIHNLRNRKLKYPENTTKLKTAIEQEFLNRRIHSEPRILSDLLEIIDPIWQNAVEGYLNTQRFDIIIEPQHYQIALDVYNLIKKEIHTVGLVNTTWEQFRKPVEPHVDSLAYVVTSDNRWALAYTNFLLDRVNRCPSVDSLKEHKVAVTNDCMLYQNHAIRKINDEVFKTPFIGANAYEVQLASRLEALAQIESEIETTQQNIGQLDSLVQALSACNLELVEENLHASQRFKALNERLVSEKIELKKATSDPSLIQLHMQIESCKEQVQRLQKDSDKSGRAIGILEQTINSDQSLFDNSLSQIDELKNALQILCDKDLGIAELGLAKFNEQIRQKSPDVIVQNFSPQMTGLQNKKHDLIWKLKESQLAFCIAFDSDLGDGLDQMPVYVDEHYKLISADIIKYESDLQKAKENCQLEFKESFLARLKENIETANLEFKNLNQALRGIYYGDDSYKFVLSYNKQKESLYRMITAKNNEVGFNLWSQTFETEYHDEMEDLFAKLTAYDDIGENVLKEYTDYRSYLDYDIQIEKQDGTVQRFSRIYGEKSGGETQTPYYVAIAASFVQLYKSGDTIRTILFDEAFDKMDDNRIGSMMDFLNRQNFQIILATPPSKIEVIGEKVDTILIALRDGQTSIIEEYDL
ncbi:MAG: SbcC/MukB-like Walker B domain-containing protein [Eubacteriales bacterium]|nr:SbcC/MukB-like Walker B domain-containing protein [Eubacteriales bacterium]